MPATFNTDAGGLWAMISPGSSVNFALEFTGAGPADSIASETWSADSGLTITQTSLSGLVASAWIGGGVAGNWYSVACSATTVGGVTAERSFRVFVSDGTQAPVRSTVFPSLPGVIATIRRDRLVVAAQQYFPNVTLDDDYLAEQISVAEADIQRRLRVWFTPREVIPDTADPSEAVALMAAGNIVETEPGYDYSPELFCGNSWGWTELRQRPAQAVHSIRLVWPTPSATFYEIPADWIRLDKKYGKINLVPTALTASVPLSAMMLAMIGGGSTIPLMMQIRYRAGLANAAADWPDVLDAVKKQAVLALIEDTMPPPSASASIDGLSQSISADMGKLEEMIERKVDRLRSAIHGIRLGVL